VLEFKANRLGEKLTQSITIENPIPDTLLEGRWEVAPHPQDPPHTPDNHAWISVTPVQFNRNNIRCQVEADTSKLRADKQYKRQLILHSNAYPASHTLTVKVQTAALPIEKRKIKYWGFIGLLIAVVIAPTAIIWSIPYFRIEYFLISLPMGFGYFLLCRKIGSSMDVAVASAVGMAVSGAMGMAVSGAMGMAVSGAMGMAVSGAMGMAVYFAVSGVVYLAVSLTVDSFTTVLMLLVLGFGISVGTGIIIGFLNLFILLALTGTSLPALSMLLYPPLKRRKLIAKYRHSEESLIKP
jgi:hypothetical protein